MIDPKYADYYLYIIMRNDLVSMNAGKAMAQACHAANQFVYEHKYNEARDACEGFEAWEDSAYEEALMNIARRRAIAKVEGKPEPEDGPVPCGFGTTIVLSANERELEGVVAFAKQAGVPAGITNDPSYPLIDRVCVPMNTCGYVFGSKAKLIPLLAKFNLHP